MGPAESTVDSTGESSGPAVVVTTMPLSEQARADLSEMLGDGYVVVDIKHAPSSANVVLTPVVSGQLLGILRMSFPTARILFTELHDESRGISFEGPLSRIAAHGPDGYFVAHELDSLAPIVQSEARLQLSGSTRPTPPRFALSPPVAQEDDAEPDRSGDAAVVWVRDQTSSSPTGRWLTLDRIDDLVRAVTSTATPRDDPLWAAIVSECAARMLTVGVDDVLVDVGSLSPAIVAELEIRCTSEGVPHRRGSGTATPIHPT